VYAHQNRILIQVSQMYAVAWYTRVNVLVRSTRLLTRQLTLDNRVFITALLGNASREGDACTRINCRASIVASEEIELHSHESILQRRLNRILIQVSQMYAVAWYTRVHLRDLNQNPIQPSLQDAFMRM
jgi:hypothetical protein